jgi:hypothetical protein
VRACVCACVCVRVCVWGGACDVSGGACRAGGYARCLLGPWQ